MVNTFTPKALLGINAACWRPKRDMDVTQAKVQAEGNFAVRYPGARKSDDYHWNGAGSCDQAQHWVPSSDTYTAGFEATGMSRGTTSGGYQSHGFLTDGAPATRWLSNTTTTFPAAQWAYVDLGVATTFDSLRIV